MRTADFDFHLPTQLVAQSPAPDRHLSRLLLLERAPHRLSHRQFSDFPGLLQPGDVLVLNDSKVIPARLRGMNHETGGQFEILLLEENGPNDWWAMLRPGKRARVGTRIDLAQRRTPIPPAPSTPPTRAGSEAVAFDVHALVTAINSEGHRRLQFIGTKNILDDLDTLGEMPLPPYIKRDEPNTSPADRERYQTVYAQAPGSVAAPTAGLHFTPALLDRIRATGVQVCQVTLHVGLGTFAPLKAENLAQHVMHEERYAVPQATADAINAAKREGRRVIAVGTTTLRVLESSVAADARRLTLPDDPTPSNAIDQSLLTPAATLAAGSGRTRIFIHPPFRFRIVDALLTNFHLPRSTLLMLVSAFASPDDTRGRDTVLAAYQEAISQGYRFFSYGDAMFIV